MDEQPALPCDAVLRDGATPDDHEVRYVALGDSSTEGLEDPDGNGGHLGWATRLAGRLAEVHGRIAYANLAVRGYDTHQMLSRQLADAVALRPTLATVVGGMNDLLRVTRRIDDVLADLSTMQRTLMAVGATVVSATIPDPSIAMPITRPLRTRVDALNEGIRAAAADGVLVADLAAADLASDARLWHHDRLHANAEGHRRIAAALAATLDLPAEDWRTPLEGEPSRWSLAAEREWAQAHFLPWLARRLRGESSGDGRTCRHPDYVVVEAAGSSRTASRPGDAAGPDDVSAVA